MLHGCTMMQQCALHVSFARYCPFCTFCDLIFGVSHSKGVHSKVSLCEPPLLWSTFCGRWCLTPYTPSIWV